MFTYHVLISIFSKYKFRVGIGYWIRNSALVNEKLDQFFTSKLRDFYMNITTACFLIFTVRHNPSHPSEKILVVATLARSLPGMVAVFAGATV